MPVSTPSPGRIVLRWRRIARVASQTDIAPQPAVRRHGPSSWKLRRTRGRAMSKRSIAASASASLTVIQPSACWRSRPRGVSPQGAWRARRRLGQQLLVERYLDRIEDELGADSFGTALPPRSASDRNAPERCRTAIPQRRHRPPSEEATAAAPGRDERLGRQRSSPASSRSTRWSTTAAHHHDRKGCGVPVATRVAIPCSPASRASGTRNPTIVTACPARVSDRACRIVRMFRDRSLQAIIQTDNPACSRLPLSRSSGILAEAGAHGVQM